MYLRISLGRMISALAPKFYILAYTGKKGFIINILDSYATNRIFIKS